ncbi:IclR family transcriptional regulator domain-containing protein [Campylobacter vulpis]
MLEKIDANNQTQLKSFIGTSYLAYIISLNKTLLTNKSKNELKIYSQAFQKITKNTITSKNCTKNYNKK